MIEVVIKLEAHVFEISSTKQGIVPVNDEYGVHLLITVCHWDYVNLIKCRPFVINYVLV